MRGGRVAEGGKLGEFYCCKLRDRLINTHGISKEQESIGRSYH